MDTTEKIIIEFLDGTAPLLPQIDSLPVEMAVELYGMFDNMAKSATEHIKEIDTSLRVRLCAGRDEILERIADEMPPLNAGQRSIYTPSLTPVGRWRNVELMKDCGIVVYLLGKEMGMHPVMLYGQSDEQFPYLDMMPGLEVLKTDAGPKDMSVYYKHLEENYGDMDMLAMYGMYPCTPEYINKYRTLRPDGKVYFALDMNRHWMKNIPWSREDVKKAVAGCDIIATSARPMRDALNANPEISFPCHWFTNGLYNPAGIPLTADPEKKENIILTVGRIGTDQKNNMELMIAFAIASQALPGWTLRLAGGIEPEFLPKIDEYFKQFPDLRERVVFTGAITEKTGLYKEYERAKIFALTSTTECFPNVYAEALFHGCMFITSDVDPAEDMTKSGELGMVYKLGDYATLAASLVKMGGYADKDAFRKYIPRALDYANKYFDWNRNIKKLAYMLFR